MQDLESLTIEQLAALRDAAIVKLEEKVATRQQELQAEMERVAGFVAPAVRRPGAAAMERPRYRHPQRPELVWSGRGAQASWVKDYVAAGGSLDELKVA
jgi:DNA-binding protein H-NS